MHGPFRAPIRKAGVFVSKQAAPPNTSGPSRGHPNAMETMILGSCRKRARLSRHLVKNCPQQTHHAFTHGINLSHHETQQRLDRLMCPLPDRASRSNGSRGSSTTNWVQGPFQRKRSPRLAWNGTLRSQKTLGHVGRGSASKAREGSGGCPPALECG